MAVMEKKVEYQCIYCKGASGKFKTPGEMEKHRLEVHRGNNASM